MRLNELIGKMNSANNGSIIPTGMTALDNLIGGLRRGQVYTVAGRTGMGTTTFAITVVRNVAVFGGIPTAYLTLDGSEEMVAERLLKARGSRPIDIRKTMPDIQLPEAVGRLEQIGFTLEDSQLQQEAYQRQLCKAPVWIENVLGMKYDEILARMEQLQQEHDLQVVIIDNLAWIINAMNHCERQSVVIRLQQIAEKLNIAVLLLAGLSQRTEIRIDCRPMLSDLRGGTGADIFSSVVLLLYRPEYYCIDCDDRGETRGIADVIVAKNKYGALKTVRMDFHTRTAFEDL